MGCPDQNIHHWDCCRDEAVKPVAQRANLVISQIALVKENTVGFITGSHAYGTPHEDSDIDLVVLVDGDDSVLLCKYSEDQKEGDYHTFRYGKLNLILIVDPVRYETWAGGTEQLKLMKPVTREYAVEFFQTLFKLEKEKTDG